MGDFDRPFLGSVAVAAGAVTTRQLRVDCTRLFRDVYVCKGVTVDALVRAHAAAIWAGDDGILAGLSAAAIHGALWIDPNAPAEVFRTGSRRPPPRTIVHGDALEPDEFGLYAGRLASKPARTAYDLGRRLPLDSAIATIDALCRATGLQPDEITAVAERHPGTRGIVSLRAAIELVDAGAESPQETRTRLLLVRAGLPRPTTQIPIVDECGRVVARADLGWERWRVLVEYDGIQHWTDEEQRAWDHERSELLERLGWKVIHVSSKRLRLRPHEIVDLARGKLREAGAPA
ncbi:DUF559 domain-containing protein [Antrihabitans sp. YC3-6]|uniref:DUF559 domain-containing protein n=1 Tax=Antrihabitans stalagmiti TaxID=2799499 RepID=A0A934NSM1_9NOCA|nr:DUF559 domain-containing protein [Antrihabitans stalagmiti]MBJ8340568.1 DUF559 domain-containing protein [Antrihabitans stalagmiti]